VKIKVQVHIPKKRLSNNWRILRKPTIKIRNKTPENIKSGMPVISNENPVIIPRIRNMESLIMVEFINCIPLVLFSGGQLSFQDAKL